MTKQTLVNIVSKKVHLTKKAVKEAVDSFFEETISALDISDERYETLVDRAYEECLHKNGL